MSSSKDLRLIFGLLSSLTMFDYAYTWKKSFNDHNDVSYLMLDDDSLMYVVSIMTYKDYKWYGESLFENQLFVLHLVHWKHVGITIG